MDRLEEAVKQVLAGDVAAFRRIVDGTSVRLVRLSARIMGNVADAEDIVQEAYAKAYRAIVQGHFDGRARVETWLYRIVVNATIDAKRRRQHQAPPSDQADEVPWEGAPSADARLALFELSELIGTLPIDQQTALILRSVEGFSSPEIADILCSSEGRVEQLLVRARAGLRKRLDAQEEDAS